MMLFSFSIVGLALIGGLIACINRRGGCTKRTEKKNDLEDYGLGDFPHQRTSGPAPPMVMNNNKPVSPTLPRLNEQGNYYQDDAYGYSNHHGVHYVDNNMDYGMQPQQQHYYYPQQEYYDDGGYYYDSNTSGTAYSPQAPMQHNSSPMHSGVVAGQQYMMNNSNVPTLPQHNVYKPDEAGKALH
ncbi:uncharacterized protein B0P05DRAFT_563471 [Gilbertella persicaria]|uniref:uncharacterized protein n=1 Tax=Gilbertella persicaria TaxID=101096 RepID=UPI0022206263|nr:uncharacterized protein B0P05DRAFT_563471 [Gilbertella persicaria]KAI8049807.1 hypothetical protein B0P05DRAFT_563471 [Gilbertella persicaria]